VLTSSDFERVVQPLLERSIVPVVRLLKALDLTAGDVDEIVMVGGTTRMPQIRHLVQAAFPDSQLNTRIDPDITVAYGAASVID
jgi:molecular chaperone DnaK (HSP70)